MREKRERKSGKGEKGMEVLRKEGMGVEREGRVGGGRRDWELL